MNTHSKIYGFLSHKAKDKMKAEALKRLLTTSGGGKLELFLSSTDIKGGEVWRSSIWENMKKSNFLILLYLNPDDDWDWCLFETGYFRGTNKGPVFCIHPQRSTVPAPLEDLQNVEAKPKIIKETFLKPLFSDGKDEFALNPALFTQDNIGILDKLAGDIVKVVGSKPQFFPLLPRVIFSLTAAQMKSARDTGKVPDEASIEFDPKSKVIFQIDISVTEMNWGAFKECLTEAQSIWLSEMEQQMPHVKHTGLYPTFGLISDAAPPVKRSYYRPIMSGISMDMQDTTRIHVIFVPIKTQFPIDSSLAKDRLFHVLTVLQAFRWRIIQKYDEKLLSLSAAQKEPMAWTKEQESVLRDFRIDFVEVMQESKNRGLFHEEQLLKALGSDDLREQVKSLNKKWGEEITEGFQKAMDEGNAIEMSKYLRQLDEMNRIYFSVITLALSQEWGK